MRARWSTLDDPAAAARRIVEAGLTVRDAEALGESAGRQEDGAAASEAGQGRRHARAGEGLTDRLGLAVDDRPQGAGGGKVTVRYRTLEQLDDICRRLRG